MHMFADQRATNQSNIFEAATVHLIKNNTKI